MTKNRSLVLVHGAMHGAWAWQRVVPLLAAQGVVPHLVTLTGLGERRRFLHRSIDLEYHATDVAEAIVANDLKDVVLVGHSQGGIVVSRAASMVADRMRALVYLDAVVTPNGEAAVDIIPREAKEMLYDNAARTGAGWLVTPNEEFLDSWGIADPAHRKWVWDLLAPHPLAVFQQRVDLSRLRASGMPTYYVRCTESHVAGMGFMAIAQQFGARVLDVEGKHEAPLTVPDKIAHCLLGIVRES